MKTFFDKIVEGFYIRDVIGDEATGNRCIETAISRVRPKMLSSFPESTGLLIDVTSHNYKGISFSLDFPDKCLYVTASKLLTDEIEVFTPIPKDGQSDIFREHVSEWLNQKYIEICKN